MVEIRPTSAMPIYVSINSDAPINILSVMPLPVLTCIYAPSPPRVNNVTDCNICTWNSLIPCMGCFLMGTVIGNSQLSLS